MCRITEAKPDKDLSSKVANAGKKSFSYGEVREHRTHGDGWMVIHNKVYDLSKFDHPAGSVIDQAYGREATLLYESHHAAVKDYSGDKRFDALLKKYYIGDLRMENDEPLPVHPKFDTKFGKDLTSRLGKHFKETGHPTRDHPYSIPIVLFNVTGIILSAIWTAKTGSMLAAFIWGIFLSFGHGSNHALIHHQVTSISGFNTFFSFLPNLWGMSDRYWEFSHNISHHMYCYNDKDYMVEQHLPSNWFRIYEDAEWKPYHKYQHYYYLFAPVIAFLYGGFRPTCAPFVFAYPLIAPFFNRASSPIPCPSFMATGSSHDVIGLSESDDACGQFKSELSKRKFVVWDDDMKHTMKRMFFGSLMTLPVWLAVSQEHGYAWATWIIFVAFGTQSGIVIKSLLLQHLADELVLDKDGFMHEDWWKHQIVTSVDIDNDGPGNFLIEYGLLQVMHHLLPCFNGFRIKEVRPIVEQLCKEYNVPYNTFMSQKAGHISGFTYLKRLSVDPNADRKSK